MVECSLLGVKVFPRSQVHPKGPKFAIGGKLMLYKPRPFFNNMVCGVSEKRVFADYNSEK
jgi:hypothetical protein